ncbi:MAG: ribosomal RNA small subunit methyltransferase A [Acidobacteria bacterium]|nr:ribosomal RNA small subunit methyltransferase A [Acidobacteriota bacterium]
MRQRLGQHFLRDPRIAGEIVAALPPDPGRVIEIGPGQGALTRPLLDRYATVRVIELDRRLASGLAGRLSRPAGLEVIQGDAVDFDLDRLASQGPWLVAGNLPYSVATPIVRRLMVRLDLFKTLVVMVQLEVAERMVARAEAPARGLLSLEVEAHSRAEVLFEVPPDAFAPVPEVTSAVLRFTLIEPPEGIERVLRLASAAFSMRRKTMANGLAPLAGREVVQGWMSTADVDPGRRPQDLQLADWLRLAAAAPVGLS